MSLGAKAGTVNGLFLNKTRRYGSRQSYLCQSGLNFLVDAFGPIQS
jgi:hypothetical protein